jgi:AcrR family transcriptional regulator
VTSRRPAGLARRTLYGPFAGRAALFHCLAADAGEAVRRASATVARPPTPDPVTALALFVLTLWPIGDRYRILIALALAHCDLGPDRVDALLGPARDTVAGILADGRRQGVFHTVLPPGPLGRALEAHMPALLDSVGSGRWTDDGTAAATAALIIAGIGPDLATTTVHRLRPSR